MFSVDCLNLNFVLTKQLQDQKRKDVEPRVGFLLIGATFESKSLRVSYWSRSVLHQRKKM